MARQALGKGLGALIPGLQKDIAAEGGEGKGVQELELGQIKPNPFQPRTVFRPEELKELADSIREQGVLQPVLVVRSAEGGYALISGERRLRAAQSLGWKTIPALVKPSATKEEMAEWAIIENVQRDDLNPLEEARAYKRLLDEFKLTQDEVARKVGRDRASVANSVRLLKLPREVQALLESGELMMGHARALLGIENPAAQKALAAKAAKEAWSVRAVEQAVQAKAQASGGQRRAAVKRGGGGPEAAALEDRLRRALGAKVKLHVQGKGGRIEIFYYTEEELERLLEVLT